MLARQIAVGFGIALIFPLLVYYGVATFYPTPKYQEIVTATLVAQANSTPEQRKEYEEQRQKQQQAYNAAAKDFARVLAMVTTPVGVVAILVGASLALNSIGTGLIFGGILRSLGAIGATDNTSTIGYDSSPCLRALRS